MNKNHGHILLPLFCGFFLATSISAQPPLVNTSLMTARDFSQNTLSNISLINGTSQRITASGLFTASYDINDCSSCFGGVVSGDNAGGAVMTPVVFGANQTVPIGQNFLYNMIYNGIYYIKNTVGSSPCSLPGCTWPGDDPNVHGWCITINVTSLDSSYTYSHYTNGSELPANAPPYSAAGNSVPFNYRYDLIDPNTLGTGNACLGPIVCNDKTLTCRVSTPQSETLQSYS